MALQQWQTALSDSVDERFKADAQLLQDEQYSDLTIVCGPKTFRVHKAIVCTRSEFFRLACLKHAFKEGETSVINLKARQDAGDDENFEADEPEAVECMVRYLYLHDYQNTEAMSQRQLSVTGLPHEKSAPLASKQRISSLATHAEVFAVAMKYSITGLKSLAKAHFERNLESHIMSDTEIAEAIPIIYKTTPDHVVELRDLMRNVLLHPKKNMLENPEIEAAIASVDGLCYQLYKRAIFMRKQPQSGTHDCEHEHSEKNGAHCKGCFVVYETCVDCWYDGLELCSDCADAD